MTKIWLVGAKGALGTSIRRQLKGNERAVLATDIDLDITDESLVAAFASRERPTHIINCSAYTRVDAAESDEARAIAVNGAGPRHLASAAAAVGATFCHVSTDYVFDGTNTEPYHETCEPCPLGVYGRSKLQGDLAVLGNAGVNAAERRTFVVRTSWLYGEQGPNFVLTMLRLMGQREQLRVVADQIGCPTYTRDLGEAILALCALNDESVAPAATGIYHFSNSQSTTWHKFAEAIRAEAVRRGWPVTARSVDAIASSQYPTPAPRPAYSVLDTQKISEFLGRTPRSWSGALSEYLDTLVPPF